MSKGHRFITFNLGGLRLKQIILNDKFTIIILYKFNGEMSVNTDAQKYTHTQMKSLSNIRTYTILFLSIHNKDFT